jgi:arabinan endo-1,5-alpha-L-arabinosidase
MTKSFTRRQFLKFGFTLSAAAGLSSVLPVWAQTEPTPEVTPEADSALELTGRLKQVHDPVMIKDGDTYYLFCTGNGIPVRKSADMLDWDMAFPPSVFSGVPDWALEKIPGATNIWAPDISYYNGKFHLYYSVSTFGSNRSVIGLATNATLDFESEAFEWVDQGLVIESTGAEPYNCIDPNLIIDADGAPWLAFGSFWSGLKMVRLELETGKPAAEDNPVIPIAQRFVNDGSIEAAFIILKDGFYYLFASHDFCCRGVDSTYHVVVGRSEAVTGPYLDRDGVEMLQGGGTQITFPTDRWKGPGHNGILLDDGVYYIVYHSYDADSQGVPTLRINPLTWDADGWPSL